MDSILIIDDNRQVLEQLKEVLGSEGYHVAFIPRADFLFERLEKDNFDLLLLDINLPGKSGIEWLKELKANSKFKDLPVIMITGEDERRTLAKCFELGANDYVHKPINEIALKSRVRAAITSKRFIEQKLELEKQKSLQSKMMMLSAQMNPHFIFNSLGSVQSFILANETNKAVNYLSDFAGLMRENLENSTLKYISIADEIRFLERYIELERIRFNNAFDYTFEVNIDNIHDTLIPPMFLQPFIENAIIHGLSGLNRPSKLEIVLSETNDKIKCIILDNGIGRVSAKKNKDLNHKSVAISNLEARLEILNMSSIDSEYNFEIIDLFKGKQPSGTKVLLTFPNDLH